MNLWYWIRGSVAKVASREPGENPGAVIFSFLCSFSFRSPLSRRRHDEVDFTKAPCFITDGFEVASNFRSFKVLQVPSLKQNSRSAAGNELATSAESLRFHALHINLDDADVVDGDIIIDAHQLDLLRILARAVI